MEFSTCILPGRIRFLARMMTLAEKLAPEMIRGSSNRPMEEFLILLLQAVGEFLLELLASGPWDWFWYWGPADRPSRADWGWVVPFLQHPGWRLGRLGFAVCLPGGPGRNGRGCASHFSSFRRRSPGSHRATNGPLAPGAKQSYPAQLSLPHRPLFFHRLGLQPIRPRASAGLTVHS